MKLFLPLAWKYFKIGRAHRNTLSCLGKSLTKEDKRSSTLNFLLQYLNLKGGYIHKGVVLCGYEINATDRLPEYHPLAYLYFYIIGNDKPQANHYYLMIMKQLTSGHRERQHRLADHKVLQSTKISGCSDLQLDISASLVVRCFILPKKKCSPKEKREDLFYTQQSKTICYRLSMQLELYSHLLTAIKILSNAGNIKKAHFKYNGAQAKSNIECCTV